MTYPIDPHYQPQREMDPGMTAATWMSVAFIVLLFAGVGIWAYYNDDAISTASVNRPGVEQSAPPATTGQGATREPVQ